MFLSLLRDNNYIKDFPQLADGLMVIPLPVEEQCRGVLSEPLPNLQLLTGTSAGLRRLCLLLKTPETSLSDSFFFFPVD